MKIKHDVAIQLESLEKLVVCIIGLHSIVILIIINRMPTYILESKQDSMLRRHIFFMFNAESNIMILFNCIIGLHLVVNY